MAAAEAFPVLSSQAYLDGEAARETRALVADLCRQFYTLGWVSGTGGSITIKVHDDAIPKPHQLIVMSPSGVQKERMAADDMYVLSSEGDVLSAPSTKPYPNKAPKCSDCAPLFMKAYQMRNAGAVIHSHGMESCLVTMINPLSKEFRITHMEMIKGIQGHGYYDELVIPIIENTAHERELTKSLTEAISAYPKATAVLVRNHGIYVWGDSWISAKTQAECYHYLFEAAIKLHQLGIDWTSPGHGPIGNNAYKKYGYISSDTSVEAGLANGTQAPDKQRKCILLDIEGTTTPVSFVTEVLFPYARNNVRKHLISTYDSEETQDDIKLLRAQGHIWRTGFENKELQGVVFDDVPEALKRWHTDGIKVYIYSSGSREAQRLVFGHSEHGDLRKYLCGFFDTTVGNKREPRSYFEISQSVGVDTPSQILFVTDVYQEAIAAKAAGLDVIISIRPGNAPLPDYHGFQTVTSFAEI
ncbi:hypothetical protein KFK09_027072 [Dendrobium nobile]|uniref:Probable bifunctional methylthioribulose-1-phosphate dehydratase/enolase-phosphatase E1 n=1 Tax=Dendrobium nobile TaxID=94219 RepID=A0A8T3A8C7_DENNO|nr:hypothetical protein KFK09_027072 [Dendrobium nobile]